MDVVIGATDHTCDHTQQWCCANGQHLHNAFIQSALQFASHSPGHTPTTMQSTWSSTLSSESCSRRLQHVDRTSQGSKLFLRPVDNGQHTFRGETVKWCCYWEIRTAEIDTRSKIYSSFGIHPKMRCIVLYRPNHGRKFHILFKIFCCRYCVEIIRNRSSKTAKLCKEWVYYYWNKREEFI